MQFRWLSLSSQQQQFAELRLTVLSPCTTVKAISTRKALDWRMRHGWQGVFRLFCLPGVVVAVWACVYSVEIVYPLYPSLCITQGSVLFSPGDSQSVLALQYTERNCNIQETSSVVGPSNLQPMWDSSAWICCVSECICMHVYCHCNPVYFHKKTDLWLVKDGCNSQVMLLYNDWPLPFTVTTQQTSLK